ncbi:MAG: hypothetical protein C0499_02360 [Zymomonas sp.]|nr:hypothetical protein [Zymomonas sp.]
MKRAKPAKRYPALPSEIEGPAGTVIVTLTKAKVTFEGAECGGLWDAGRREITLDAKESRRNQWKYYYHEWGHVMLCDSGLDNAIPADIQETICDAIATARMRERFG